MKLIRLLLVYAVLAVGIAACTQMPSQPTPVSSIAQAENYAAQRNYQQAADLYLISAQKASIDKADLWRSKAAKNAWLAKNISQAERILSNVDEANLTPDARAQNRMLAANIALHHGDPVQARQLLGFSRNNLPTQTQQQILELLDRINVVSGTVGSSDEQQFARFNQHVASGNNNIAWNTLSLMSSHDLSKWLTRANSTLQKGWIELAYIAKTAIYSPTGLGSALNRWQQTYPDHPAKNNQFLTLRKKENAQPAGQLNQIAVFLPMSGRLERVAKVILDGIISAKYQQGGATNIQVYDTADGAGDIFSKYKQAVAEGAELIIGPMEKTQVDELARMPLSAPVLTLNYGKQPNLYNANLYQSALLPEDEAHQMAELIARAGLKQTGVLTPSGDWGDRIANAFTQRTRELGGTVIASASYNRKSSNHSQVIRSTLGAQARQGNLQAIFMAATPATGRLIKPLLKYHNLDSIPVFATSHIYTGKYDINADHDLNGVTFTEIPWLLDRSSGPNLSELDAAARSHPRLFAFGFDSYHLAQQLKSLTTNIGDSLPGLTGDIYIGQHNRVHRRLKLARFQKGKPIPVAPPQPAPQ